MIKYSIEINCPRSRLEENETNQQRLEACYRFERTDRTPVVFGINERYLFPARAAEFDDYFENPQTQLEQRLLNQKWLIEHAVDDQIIDTSTIKVEPAGVARGGLFNIDVRRFNDGSSVAVPLLQRPEDIDVLEVPEVMGGLYGKRVNWYLEMKELSAEYLVTLNGNPLDIDVTIGYFAGPLPEAYALTGENLFIWMLECPERVHRLMQILTTACINYQRFVRDLNGDSREHLYMGCDAAEMISPGMFKEFIVPYYLQCYAAFPGKRELHMCGNIDHLIQTIAEDLRITLLHGFGFSVDPKLLAKWMGGKVVLVGGVHPHLLLQGPVEAIKSECFRYLEIFAPCGGYVLADGHDVAPGTPIQHLVTVVEAAEEFSG